VDECTKLVDNRAGYAKVDVAPNADFCQDFLRMVSKRISKDHKVKLFS
jgi:hypothetical protein